MSHFKRTAVLAAGLVVAFAAAAPVRGADLLPSLQSFGASRAIAAYELSAPGLSGGAVQPTIAASLPFNTLVIAAGAPPFASSTVLASNLALDSGRGLDIASRFANFGDAAS